MRHDLVARLAADAGEQAGRIHPGARARRGVEPLGFANPWIELGLRAEAAVDLVGAERNLCAPGLSISRHADQVTAVENTILALDDSRLSTGSVHTDKATVDCVKSV